MDKNIFNSSIVQVREREVKDVIEDNAKKQHSYWKKKILLNSIPRPSESKVKIKVNKY